MCTYIRKKHVHLHKKETCTLRYERNLYTYVWKEPVHLHKKETCTLTYEINMYTYERNMCTYRRKKDLTKFCLHNCKTGSLSESLKSDLTFINVRKCSTMLVHYFKTTICRINLFLYCVSRPNKTQNAIRARVIKEKNDCLYIFEM